MYTRMKVGLYFGVTLAVFSTIILASTTTGLTQLGWLLVAPGLACLVFLPDMLDYLAYRYFPHHPWTHHPITLVYFIPLATLTLKFDWTDWTGALVVFAAVGWGLHMILDAGGEGLPLLWKPVRQTHPHRSYLYPISNRQGILQLPRPIVDSLLVQKLGCGIGVAWYMFVLGLEVLACIWKYVLI